MASSGWAPISWLKWLLPGSQPVLVGWAPRARSACWRGRGLERQGRNVIHLEIGEPDFETPAHVCRLHLRRCAPGRRTMCASSGMAELREAAAAYLSDSRGVEVPPGRVLIANGRNRSSFSRSFRSAAPRRGDLLPTRGFRSTSLRSRGGRSAGSAALREKKDFVFDVADLEAWSRPDEAGHPQLTAQPTGGVIDRSTVEETAALLRESHAWVLRDEVYWRWSHEGEFFSIASQPGMSPSARFWSTGSPRPTR